MRSNFLSRTRKWIGASALAILVGLGGGTAFLAASSPMAAAQVSPVAAITTPDLTAQNPGFANLVDAVKPAVVSITVEGREKAPALDQGQGNDFNGQIPDLPECGFLAVTTAEGTGVRIAEVHASIGTISLHVIVVIVDPVLLEYPAIKREAKHRA